MTMRLHPARQKLRRIAVARQNLRRAADARRNASSNVVPIKRGMTVLLPGAAALAKAGIKGAGLGSMPSSALSPVVAGLGGEVALIGRLVWDDSNSDGPPIGGSTSMAGRVIDLACIEINVVRAFDYHDQMSGKPKRDEQGTRDRPYDLIASTGRCESHGFRPSAPNAMFVEIQQGSREFVITADAEQSALQRESLEAAACPQAVARRIP